MADILRICQTIRAFSSLATKLSGLGSKGRTVTMVSSTVNVSRYTALFSGVFYGIYHRRTLQKAHEQEKEQHAVHHREQLILQAKEAWKKKQESLKDDSVITDPEDPRFDLEKLVAKWESEAK